MKTLRKILAAIEQPFEAAGPTGLSGTEGPTGSTGPTGPGEVIEGPGLPAGTVSATAASPDGVHTAPGTETKNPDPDNEAASQGARDEAATERSTTASTSEASRGTSGQ